MNKYTNTEHGLLLEPLMSEPIFTPYIGENAEQAAADYFDYTHDYRAYLKTAIPVIEGFEKKIPIGTEDLQFEVDFTTILLFKSGIVTGHAAIPLVDIVNSSKEAFVASNIINEVSPVVSHPSTSSNSIPLDTATILLAQSELNAAQKWAGQTYPFIQTILDHLKSKYK